MKVFFYLRTSKVTGIAHIYTRLYVNGKRLKTDFSTGIKCNPCDWDKELKFLKGKHNIENNAILENIQDQLTSINYCLLQKHNKVTPEMIKYEFLDNWKSEGTIFYSYYKSWINKQSLRKDISISTKKIFKTRFDTIESFLLYSKKQHILIDQVKTKFNNEFIEWMKNTKGYKHNHAMKNVKMLKRVLKDAVINEILASNPLDNFSYNFERNNKLIFLDYEELGRLRKYKFYSESLLRVRDCFLFQSYTGLSYVDLKNTDYKKQIFYKKNKPWLKATRQKTKTTFEVPLIKEAIQILKSYNFELPIISNKNYNVYLKQIAGILNINKNLSSHVARKTAAMIWANKYNISLECIQMMLGHSSIKTTEQFYARILSTRLSNEIDNALGKDW